MSTIKNLFENYENYLNQMTKSFNHLLDNSIKPIIEFQDIIFDQMGTQLLDTINTFSNSIKILYDHAELLSAEVAPMVEEAGFWITPSSGYEILERLNIRSRNEPLTPTSVSNIFIEYYEEDNHSELIITVNEWEKNPYFSSRMHILREALEGHINGNYNLTIPALFCQLEGIASCILDKPTGKTTAIVKGSINEYPTSFLHSSSIDILTRLITSPLIFGSIPKEYRKQENFQEWLDLHGFAEGQSFNRHGILHGQDTNYGNKKNSLRLFLLLDTFSFMKKDEWDSDIITLSSLP